MLGSGGGQDYGALEAPGKGQVSLSYWESLVVAFGTCDALGVGGRQVAYVSAGGPPGLGPACTLTSVVCIATGVQCRTWPCAWHMGSPPRTSDRPKLSLTHSRC